MKTFSGTDDCVLEDGSALLLLLLKIPEGKRTATQARLCAMLLDQYAGSSADKPADVRVVAAARAEFYAMPEPELRQSLQGWSPVAERPTLSALLNGLGWRRVARVLTLDIDSPKAPGPKLLLTQGFVATDSYFPVRVEVQEGTTRAEALACLQQAAELVMEHWPQLIDRDRVTEVGADATR